MSIYREILEFVRKNGRAVDGFTQITGEKAVYEYLNYLVFVDYCPLNEEDLIVAIFRWNKGKLIPIYVSKTLYLGAEFIKGVKTTRSLSNPEILKKLLKEWMS